MFQLLNCQEKVEKLLIKLSISRLKMAHQFQKRLNWKKGREQERQQKKQHLPIRETVVFYCTCFFCSKFSHQILIQTNEREKKRTIRPSNSLPTATKYKYNLYVCTPKVQMVLGGSSPTAHNS